MTNVGGVADTQDAWFPFPPGQAPTNDGDGMLMNINYFQHRIYYSTMDRGLAVSGALPPPRRQCAE